MLRPFIPEHVMSTDLLREKEGDLTQTYDKNPYTNGKFENQWTTQNIPPKTSITQRLRTDLGRPVGVTTVIQPVWLNWFTGTKPSLQKKIPY